MSTPDERALDALMRQVGAELARGDDALELQSEAYLRWLAGDLRAGLTGPDRDRDQADAKRFAARVRGTILLRRAELRLPRQPLRRREAPIAATVAQGLDLARSEGCAAMLDLAAAAGEGRDIWDEPCESWVSLPADVPRGRVLALRVSGDSMAPLLGTDDVILVHLDARPAVDDIVLAQVEDGYVVKRLAAFSSDRIELESFNSTYAPIVGRADQVRVLGVIVARLALAD